jgi:hypothetical protein
VIIDNIYFGSKKIEFQLVFSERKTLGITVRPDLKVLVRAPNGTPFQKIKDKLHKRAPWIIRQQNLFLTFHPFSAEKKYIGGETHLFKGRQYRLRIMVADKEDVKLKGQFIEVNCKDTSQVKQLLSDWYNFNAQKSLIKIAYPLVEKFKKHQVEPQIIEIKYMPTRWGSCTPKGKILLNPELLKVPRGCIEYVIIHELCHLVYYNHSNDFLELLSQEMPDWIKWKFRLEKLMA